MLQSSGGVTVRGSVVRFQLALKMVAAASSET